MRWGRTDVGADRLALDADRIYLFDVGGALVRPLVVGSLVAHLDGLGAGAGEQRLRPVAMNAGDPATLVLGDEVALEDGFPGGWVHFTFDDPPTLLAGVEPRLGFATGPSSALARLAGLAGQVGVSSRYASVYGAAPDVAGVATDVGLLASLCAVGVEPWIPPDVSDDDLAALPLRVGQAALGRSGAVGDPVDAVAGWHYSTDDPPPHSSGIARAGGPLADLVGQRVRVTAAGTGGAAPRSCVVYLHNEEDFDDDLAGEDLSLARAAFDLLAPLWTEELPVSVEVLA